MGVRHGQYSPPRGCTVKSLRKRENDMYMWILYWIIGLAGKNIGANH